MTEVTEMTDATNISVVIATHNRAHLVSRAINSVLAGAPCDREVIVVNDGSTDQTSAALRHYGGRIRVLERSHGERAAARNAGLEVARGRFVAFLDDDDEFCPGGIEALAQALSSTAQSVPLAYGRRVLVYADDSRSEPCALPNLGADGNVLVRLLNRNFIFMGGCLMRTEAVRRVGGFDSAYIPMEDWHLMVRLAEAAEVCFVDREVVNYWIHGDNTPPHLAFPVKCRYLLSGEFQTLLCRLRAGQRHDELAAVGEIITRQAVSCQHRRQFAIARRLMRLVPLCGKPYPLFGPAQLWRSWLPRRDWSGRSGTEARLMVRGMPER